MKKKLNLRKKWELGSSILPLQAVRHLNETQWKRFIDGNSTNQQLLDDNLLGLLNYILKMDPETIYWPKVSQKVKDELEKGGLNIELEDLSFTFHGKPLTEEPCE